MAQRRTERNESQPFSGIMGPSVDFNGNRTDQERPITNQKHEIHVDFSMFRFNEAYKTSHLHGNDLTCLVLAGSESASCGVLRSSKF